MSNLSHLLHRIITDGKYKSVLFIHANSPIMDNDFFAQLADLSSGEYAMFNMNATYADFAEGIPEPELEWRPPRQRYGILQVIFLNYDDLDTHGMQSFNCVELEILIRKMIAYYKTQNVVLVNPMYPIDRVDFWKCFDHMQGFLAFTNCSVIFYQNQPPKMVNSNRKALELFVVNPGEHVEIDVENCVGHECNLNEKIFGSFHRASNLTITTASGIEKSVTQTPLRRGSDTFINLGNADYYLSNFIARNLRVEDVSVQQLMHYNEIGISSSPEKRRIRNFDKILDCNTSNEKNYAELYNVPAGPQNLEFHRQWVSSE